MGSAVLDTALGLAFAFFVLSLVCSGIVEWIANVLNKRAAFLLRGLQQLLDGQIDRQLERQSLVRGVMKGGKDDRKQEADAAKKLTEDSRDDDATVRVPEGGFTRALLGHPLIQPLKRPSVLRGASVHTPAYLPASTVSRALLDLLLPTERTNSETELVAAVNRLPAGCPGRFALEALARDAGSNLDRLRENIENWYDEQMRQVSGWYKRWAKKWLIALALVIAIAANADSLTLALALYRDEPLHSAVVAQAVSATDCPPATDGDGTARQECIAQQREALEKVRLPIGWTAANRPTDWDGWILKILGWLLTAMAAAIGAPFWFDALGKLGSWRNTGPRPAQST